MTKSTPALDSLENVWVAFLDFAEAVGRPFKSDERRSLSWLPDLFDASGVHAELRSEPVESGERFERLLVQILGLVDPEPCSRIAPERNLDNMEAVPTANRSGLSVLQGVRMGYDVQPETVLRNVDRLNSFLREADTLMRELKDSFHVLGYGRWADFMDQVVHKRQSLKLIGRTPRKLAAKINAKPKASKQRSRPSVQRQKPLTEAEMAERRKAANEKRRATAAAKRAEDKAKEDARYVPMFALACA